MYERDYASLVRFAAVQTRNLQDAEDLVQEAFERTQARLKHLVETDRLGGYLRVAIINGARSLHRKRTSGWWRIGELKSGLLPPADDRILKDEQHREIARAVSTLSKRQHQAVVLRYWADLDDSEIGKLLGISQSSVRSNISRGLAKVSSLLTERNERDA